MGNEIIEAMKEARRKAHEQWWDAAMCDRLDIPEPDYEAITLRAALETALAAEGADHPWNKLWNAAYGDDQ